MNTPFSHPLNPEIAAPKILQRTQLISIFCLTALFSILAYFNVATECLLPLDQSINQFFSVHQYLLLTNVLDQVNLLGNRHFLLFFTIAFIVILASRYYYYDALHLLGLFFLIIAVSWVLKEWFKIPRPGDLTATYGGWAFPSGHVTRSAGMYSFIAILLLSASKHYWQKIAVIFGVALLTTLIMLSRLYFGVHWLTDVLGALLLGVTLSLFTSYHYFKRPPLKQPTLATYFLMLGLSFVIALLGYLLKNMF